VLVRCHEQSEPKPNCDKVSSSVDDEIDDSDNEESDKLVIDTETFGYGKNPRLVCSSLSGKVSVSITSLSLSSLSESSISSSTLDETLSQFGFGSHLDLKSSKTSTSNMKNDSLHNSKIPVSESGALDLSTVRCHEQSEPKPNCDKVSSSVDDEIDDSDNEESDFGRL
jgi:hypothetical protein